MGTPDLDDIIRAWRHRTQRVSPLRLTSVCIQAIRLLAEGEPVSAWQLASASQMTLDEVKDSFKELSHYGAEFDTEGNLVSTVLSLNPTVHQFRVHERDLFAWCALDTLFLPALLGQPAVVESRCPTTAVDIQLTITPEGVEALDPPDTVLSVVIPGVTPGCAVGTKSGPQGSLCSAIYFFGSHEAASTWLATHPGLAILSVHEAWQLAHEVWIKPYAGTGL